MSVTLTQIISPMLTHVLHLGHAVVGQLGDVHQTVLAGGQLDEGAELHDAHDLAEVQGADLWDEHDGLNGLLGGFARSRRRGRR